MSNLRLGNRESFANIAKAQVHAVGTAAMNKVSSTTHENVVGYDKQMLDESCKHKIHQAAFLDITKSLVVGRYHKPKQHVEIIYVYDN